MKFLPPPYGNGSGDTISIRCESRFVDSRMEEIMQGYSCYPPALPRIRSCLQHSGRYDCEVQPAWFRGQAGSLEYELKNINIELLILRMSKKYPQKLHGYKGFIPR